MKDLTAHKRWIGGGDRNIMVENMAVYTQNDEPDVWIQFRNVHTHEEYSCRWEAFQARYSPVPD
jgi:hypothetical protein